VLRKRLGADGLQVTGYGSHFGKIGSYPNWSRIKGFLGFCESYGVDEAYICQPKQLWNPQGRKDLESLVRTLEALSSLADAKGHYPLPSSGHESANKVEIQSDVYMGRFERLYVRIGSPRKKHAKHKVNDADHELKQHQPIKNAKRWVADCGLTVAPTLGRVPEIVHEMERRRREMLGNKKTYNGYNTGEHGPIFGDPCAFSNRCKTY